MLLQIQKTKMTFTQIAFLLSVKRELHVDQYSLFRVYVHSADEALPTSVLANMEKFVLNVILAWFWIKWKNYRGEG